MADIPHQPLPCPVQALSQLEEQREWHNVAQQLAAFTSTTLAAVCAAKGSVASSPYFGSSPRVGSPTKRTPFAARSRNSHLQPNGRPGGRDENSPAVASPLGQGPPGPPPSIAVAAAAALAAKAPENPRAWLELLQARFGALRDQAAATERAALDADAALDAVRKESSWSQHKVGRVGARRSMARSISCT
jgi:hypothetical protein